MENKEKESVEVVKPKEEKPTPFLKRVNELEKKAEKLEKQVTRLSQKIEIVIKSLRR